MATSVFLSYRHENDAHRARVLDFAERLERAGVKVVLDQLAQRREFHGGGPNDGWPHWSNAQAGNAEHKILIIASMGWFRCFEKTELAGAGLGAAVEALVIAQRLYDAAGTNPDIRLVTFEPLSKRDIPLRLRPYHIFTDTPDFADLIHWLTGTEPEVPKPTIVTDWPDAPPALDWPMADHAEVRSAFGRLLTRSTKDKTWRYLPLRGQSGTGKTHVTKQMFANALSITGLACGRFDLKGTTGVDLRALIQNLDVGLPPASDTLNEQLGHILDALIKRKRPTLLVFDVYEQAGATQDWVEKLLLPSLVRDEWLRVVIAGQRLPEVKGSVWSSIAHDVIQLAEPTPEDWLAYGQVNKPDVDLETVRKMHGWCSGKAQTMLDLLGPK